MEGQVLPLLVFLSFWFALCMSQKGSSETLFLLFYSLDRYSGKAIEFAPWPPDRPYDGGFAYNCMMLEVVRDVVLVLVSFVSGALGTFSQ